MIHESIPTTWGFNYNSQFTLIPTKSGTYDCSLFLPDLFRAKYQRVDDRNNPSKRVFIIQKLDYLKFKL